MASCEKSINIDLPYPGDKIVMNTIMTNDSAVYVHITRSASAQADVRSFPELTGCKTGLYENDVLKETLTETIINGKRYYVSALRAKSSKKYTLKVSYPGLADAEGADEIPVKPSFKALDFWKADNPADTLAPYRLDIKLNDPPMGKNFYRMRILTASYNSATGQYAANINGEIRFNIDNFRTTNGILGFAGRNLEKVVYFSDETFDGQEIILNLYLRAGNSERIYVAVELSALSRSAYLYFDSKQKQIDNTDNPFSEAVVAYNNIKGGYGIVGSKADSLSIIKRRN